MPKSEKPKCHRLLWLSVVGGFMGGSKIEFAPGLNCIIGGRGAGKTTVLELIRFALDELPEERDSRKRLDALIARNLEFGRVELGIETASGMSYIVSRSSNEKPVVMTLERKATGLVLTSGSLFKADIYSQNEVESIADRSDSQLGLIDSFNPVEIADLSMQAWRVAQEADALSEDAAQIRYRISTLREETAELPSVVEQLKGMAGAGTGSAAAINAAHAQKGLRDRERRALDSLTEKLKVYGDTLQAMTGVLDQEAREGIATEMLEGANRAVFTHVLGHFAEAGKTVDKQIELAMAKLENLWNQLEAQSQSLTAAHGAQEMKFHALIEKHKVAQGEATKRSLLEKRRNDLMAKEQELKIEEEKLSKITEKRSKLLDELTLLGDQRYAKRTAIRDQLNAALNLEIRITIEQHGNKSVYREKLDELLKGSKIQEASKGKIVESLFPRELVQFVRNDDAPSLIERTGLNELTIGKIIATLARSEGLHELETVELIDAPRIELNDNKTWKDSRELSTGQKCTAILPILLLESVKPLLVDQPEDNLDNRYVSDKVVRTIIAMKKHRQLIFVTHNPNIPVLGEAERIFVLDSTGTAGRVLKRGTVDECKAEIINLLEGGKEAFDLRAERYR